MNVSNLKINHITNPVGFEFEALVVSYRVSETTAKSQVEARIEIALDEKFSDVVLDTGFDKTINPVATKLSFVPKPMTKYYWRVTVVADNGDVSTSTPAYFQTAKAQGSWGAAWIAPSDKNEQAQVFRKSIEIGCEDIVRATVYICALGLYELEVNGSKVGNEYLAPGCNAYDSWVQYQTYDVSDALVAGNNLFEVHVGQGWYKGRFGFENGGKTNQYGDELTLSCEIVIEYEDGHIETIFSDESWESHNSQIIENSIYYGEVVDSRVNKKVVNAVLSSNNLTHKLVARKSVPVVVQERILPVDCQKTNLGSYILDFGKNLVGWVEFNVDLPAGSEVVLKHAEVLDKEGNLYVENLRNAKATYKYISNGTKAICRPRFTFFGFRYVEVSGINHEINLDDFVACFISSNNQHTIKLETSNSLVNQFVQNVLCSQQGNFVDVPTDCPQRDERMGWTGDIQVFSSAACYNMDVYAFLTKFLFDLAKEQAKHNGSVPFVVPQFDVAGTGSSAWGDAATIIPWNMWLHYGDDTILKQQYKSMKDWVDYISSQVEKQQGDSLLWDSGFHFGDWLALDNEAHIRSFKGKTEDKFIASCYYHISAKVLSAAARQLGFSLDAENYASLAEGILNHIRDEYLTRNGKLALDTQTAYILAIEIDLYPEGQVWRAAQDFKAKLKRDQNQLKTGFVGTPKLCTALTKVGLNDLAYKIFTSEKMPGWLYPVKMGATSVWERWDSIDPEGNLNPDSGMNSLNHYAFGSVVEWLYKDVAGLKTSEQFAGFKHAVIEPKPNYRIDTVDMHLDTVSGEYRSYWKILPNGQLKLKYKIPFNCSATLILPHAPNENEIKISGQVREFSHFGSSLKVELDAGDYIFQYTPIVDYLGRCDISMSIKELKSIGLANEILNKYIPDVINLPFIHLLENESLEDITKKPFYKYEPSVINRMSEKLSKITI